MSALELINEGKVKSLNSLQGVAVYDKSKAMLQSQEKINGNQKIPVSPSPSPGTFNKSFN